MFRRWCLQGLTREKGGKKLLVEDNIKTHRSSSNQIDGSIINNKQAVEMERTFILVVSNLRQVAMESSKVERIMGIWGKGKERTQLNVTLWLGLNRDNHTQRGDQKQSPLAETEMVVPGHLK